MTKQLEVGNLRRVSRRGYKRNYKKGWITYKKEMGLLPLCFRRFESGKYDGLDAKFKKGK